MEINQDLTSIVSPLLHAMGLNLIEYSIGRHRGNIKLNLVLYKNGGISLNDLAKAQKILRPRLELVYNRNSLSVEISSPGLSRVIKNQLEYRVFVGRDIKLLVDEQWIGGRLMGTDDTSVRIITPQDELTIPLKRIKKARLD